MTDNLRAHFEKMQEMASRYLEPADYVDRNGLIYDPDDEWYGFISDMIYMLDGPEQREAMAEEFPPVIDVPPAMRVTIMNAKLGDEAQGGD